MNSPTVIFRSHLESGFGVAMGDMFYRAVRFLGRPVVWVSSAPIVLGAEHVPANGPCILAATHESPYDVPLLICHTRRNIDFVSIVEVFRNPLVARFYGSLNAFPLDRARPDLKTIRTILTRLEQGRLVGLFPEGGIRSGANSVVHTRQMRSGVGKLSHLAGSPIVPCVIIGSQLYGKPTSWLPLRRVRYGICYGPPLDHTLTPKQIEAALLDALVALHQRLRDAMMHKARPVDA